MERPAQPDQALLEAIGKLRRELEGVREEYRQVVDLLQEDRHRGEGVLQSSASLATLLCTLVQTPAEGNPDMQRAYEERKEELEAALANLISQQTKGSDDADDA